ncbi:hypothetical protein FNF29_08192 [Cafeteria roenbergensis]|uniref:NAD-dependent epimerase/dehydratase domain-containing protein n=1 Tax=Cafeteria roenbergensis TaxID=33653 RepID=A0A5A8C0E1_CAFRO|nr:hypothetical protein FNF29_08192 [Cafeteria roenbergensis]|eukprot:KAA0146175.1 hypothetical protein FNF29_08192 [Cafeteria roenbergensis]
MAAAAGSSADSKVVCVTGASGYVASQLVAALLAKGCTVHGTVRSVANPAKTAHLKALPGPLTASSSSRRTCSRPAPSTRRSPVAPIYGRREGNPAGHVITEAQWADEDLAAENKVHYVVSKIKAERARVGLRRERSSPRPASWPSTRPWWWGRMLQPVMNTSSAVIAGFLSGEQTAVPPATSPSWTSGTSWQRTSQPQSARPPRAGYLLVGAWRSGPTSSRRCAKAPPSELAGKLPSEIADPAAEAPWRYNNMKSTLTVDCSKATKDLGIEFRSPATSVRDLCADSVFQSLVKPVTA